MNRNCFTNPEYCKRQKRPVGEWGGGELKIPSRKTLEQIFLLISGQIGINFMKTHKRSLGGFIKKTILEPGASCEEYLVLAKGSSQELDLLINAAAVNETYFFREEKQVNLVKKIVCEKKMASNISSFLRYQKINFFITILF